MCSHTHDEENEAEADIYIYIYISTKKQKITYPETRQISLIEHLFNCSVTTVQRIIINSQLFHFIK